MFSELTFTNSEHSVDFTAVCEQVYVLSVCVRKNECAYLSMQFIQCMRGVCGQAEQHTSSFNDGLANGTCTLDRDE